MSTKKKIAAGDTLTVGELTDDHLGAEIEVGPIDGMRTRMTLDRVEEALAHVLRLFNSEGGCKVARDSWPVTVITPPPVRQPDEPTVLGQCIRIEGEDEWKALVVDPDDQIPIREADGDGEWFDWEAVLHRAGGRRIIVSDPPRWPDDDEDEAGSEEPEDGHVFERIEDLPYGWIASVTLGNDHPWGHVVRDDLEIDGIVYTHRWDGKCRHGGRRTTGWMNFPADSRSGGMNGDGKVTYTLVETVAEHDARLAPDAPEVPERIEKGEWPADDEQLRNHVWIDAEGDKWRWDAETGRWWMPSSGTYSVWPRPIVGPWTRGERVK